MSLSIAFVAALTSMSQRALPTVTDLPDVGAHKRPAQHARPTPAPEPASLLLMASGVAAIVVTVGAQRRLSRSSS